MLAEALWGMVMSQQLAFSKDGMDFGMANDVDGNRLPPFEGFWNQVMLVHGRSVYHFTVTDRARSNRFLFCGHWFVAIESGGRATDFQHFTEYAVKIINVNSIQ